MILFDQLLGAIVDGHIRGMAMTLRNGCQHTLYAALIVAPLLSGCATRPVPDRTRQAVVPVSRPSPSSAFTEAIQKGDVPEVAEILEAHPEQLNLPLGEQGWTPLQRAIRYDHLGVVEVLIEKGSDIHMPDNCGWTALHYAAMNGRVEALVLLLQKGADLNRKALQGETPLHWAAKNGQMETAVELVNRGAHLNPLDELGRTPLDISIAMGVTSLQKFFRNAGCLTASELAAVYDWISPRKTLLGLQEYQRALEKTHPLE